MAKRLQTQVQRDEMRRRAIAHARGVTRQYQEDERWPTTADIEIAWIKGFEAGLRAAAERYAARANAEREEK